MSARRGTSPGAAPAVSTATARAGTAPAWVKILVALHVFAITVWALPRPPEDIMDEKVSPRATQWLLFWNAKYLKELTFLKAYLLTTGNWQYWDMFAPDPVATDWYGEAEVTYRDGTTKAVGYPRMAALPIPLKYVKERYRKFFERSYNDSQPLLWPAFAQAMALRGLTNPANPPVKVRLRRYWLDVAPPGKPQRKTYDSYVYYTYAVDQRWLRQAEGR